MSLCGADCMDCSKDKSALKLVVCFVLLFVVVASFFFFPSPQAEHPANLIRCFAAVPEHEDSATWIT